MDSMNIAPDEYPHDVELSFISELHKISRPRVLELGTMRANPDISTHHGNWLPLGAEHIKSDMYDGIDVDVIADAHDLGPFKDEEFDAVIAISVWEHLERPWVAAEAVHRVLKTGGMVYVLTHQTFPIHGYPNDYFRFSTSAMEILFGLPLFTNTKSFYLFPCNIVPPKSVTRWDPSAKAFLNVGCFSYKA